MVVHLGDGGARAAGATDDPVLLAAGDIADCGVVEDEATARILDAYPTATVATLGDNVYDNGTASEFTNCYGPTWGRHKARTKPSPGNHEYGTANASGYFGYFGAAAGNPGQGWYSYDVGAWHVVSLNSNCSNVSCAAGSPQEQWLRADLAAHPARCTLAYWHHPRFASDLESTSVQPFWQALQDFDADVVLVGHQHNYERFALLGPTGALDTNGIRSFIVGTGGASLHSIGSPATGSQVRNDNTYGVLKLTLHPQGYDWVFLPIAGQSFTDSGTDACRPTTPDTTPPTKPAGLTAVASDRVDLSWQASSDNVGLAGYDILRDGVQIATVGPVTTYADTSIAGQTTYTYHVRARDAAGNLSPLSDPATVTTPETPRVFVFRPVADTRVEEATPSTNYGTSTLIGTDASPRVETYLRFDLSGLDGTVQSARLRLWATNGSVDGPSVAPTGSSWGETTLTWSNRPAPSGAPTDDRAAVTSSTWVEWNVSSSVTGNGPVSLVLAQPGTDGADFNSREVATNKPELVVFVVGEPPPPDTSAPTVPAGLAAAASPGRVDLSWQASSDNVGVTGYDVFRDGALLASVGAVTAFADTTVAPTTTYQYAVRARDAAGNLSALSAPVSVTTEAAPQILTFVPTADTRVSEASPTTNYGTAMTMGTDAGPAVQSLVRFDVGVLPGEVQSARLRLFVSNPSTNGPAVYPTGTAWSETGVTWATRPTATGAATHDLAAIASGAYVELDVTSLVPAAGAVGFLLAQPGTDGADFATREATNRPQLVVEVFGEPPPPPPPDTSAPTVPAGLAAAASPGRVDLSWQASSDDVGVTGYDVFRDGALLASVGAVTAYPDTTVAPTTTYQYAVRARDAAGNLSALSTPVSVTTESAPQTLTFSAVADARVESLHASTNYGGATLIGTDGSPSVATYLRFDVSGVAGTVQTARLRLFATNGSVDGPAVQQTTSGWGETTLTWANRPAATSAVIDDRVAVPKVAWSEWNVTPLVTSNGLVSFVLAQPGSDGADFHSREGTILDRRPQLVVTVAPGGAPGFQSLASSPFWSLGALYS